MQELKQALIQILRGQGKQATLRVNMLMNSNSRLFENLTDVILTESYHDNNQPIIRVGVIVFNDLAIKCKSSSNMKMFLVLQEIYECMKRILGSPHVLFENKKMLSPSLSEFLLRSSSGNQKIDSAHTQIVKLKDQILNSDSKQISIIIFEALCKSKDLPKPVKIDCMDEIFDYFLSEGQKNLQILGNLQQVGEQKNYRVFFCRLKYFIQILGSTFQSVFNVLNQPYEYDALVKFSEKQQLAEILIWIMRWKNPLENGELNYIWLEDFKVKNVLVCQLFEMNNLKQKVFTILSSIVHKTNPEFNLINSQHCLMKNIPSLFQSSMHDIFQISPQFKDLQKDYLIGSICDAILDFSSQCMRFNDIVQQFSHNSSHLNVIASLLTYLQIRDTDISTMDPEYFCNFLEGFIGSENFEEVTRYGVSKFIQMCCIKIDSFPIQFYRACFNTIVYNLHQRLASKNRSESDDFYQHLSINLRQNPESIMRNTQIYSCLIGIICIKDQISIRTDFQNFLTQFYFSLDINHFENNEIAMLYFILLENIYICESQNMVNCAQRLIVWAFESKNKEGSNFAIAIQFIKQLLNLIQKMSADNKFKQRYTYLTVHCIWQLLLSSIQTPSLENEQLFYDVLYDIVKLSSNQQTSTQKYSHSHKITNSKSHQVQSQSLLLVEKGPFIFRVLQSTSQNLLGILLRENHDEVVSLRMHQVLTKCLQSLKYLVCHQRKDIKKIELNEYCVPVIRIIMNIFSSENENNGNNFSIEEALNLVEILSILINQERALYDLQKHSSCLNENVFLTLLPVMIQHPYGQPWLNCMCEFIYRADGHFQLDQIEGISNLLKNGFSNSFGDELKLNQLCIFSINLLNTYLPENWTQIHQIVRVNLVKIINIRQQHDAIQKIRKMREFGFGSQNIVQVTMIRLFHVYLFGFKLQANNQLLSEILDAFGNNVQKYSLREATNLIIAFKSSFKQMNRDNVEKLLDILLLVLNKLLLNHNFFGNQSVQEKRIRQLSNKVRAFSNDPFQEFRLLLSILGDEWSDLKHTQKYNKSLKFMMSVNICEGQPRKIFSIVKPAI